MSIATAEEDQRWSAIAEPSRRRLLDVLIEAPGSTPSSLAEVVPITRQAVTKHLAVLDRAGLVQSERVGREVQYSVLPDEMRKATRSMAQVAAQWDKRLQTIKSIAEALHRERSKSV